MSDDYIQAIKDVLEFINTEAYGKDFYYLAYKLDRFIQNPNKYPFNL